MHEEPFEDPLRSAFFTDLYEITMAQAYFAEGMRARAVFELFFRKMPPQRRYIVAAGLEEIVSYLENLRFDESDLSYLGAQGGFSGEFLDWLRDFRFTGDVYAVAEGTIVFENEPLLQVVAPIVEAQIIETLVLNQMNFQSVLATKAMRVVEAAGGRTMVDFGARRAQGTEAAMKLARASYIAGAAGTSNLLAGKRYGIPVFGTMAHSYIQAHESEMAALEAFAALYPETTLLVDTYDTLEGVQKVIALSRKLGKKFRVGAIRLDSGDLASLAKAARRKLDGAGLQNVSIFASGGLDEFAIADLVAAGAPIDGFGVGTNLAVSNDVPSLDIAYKLVEYADAPRSKLSPGKVIIPGRKQVYRRVDDGLLAGDVIARHDEKCEGEPLLRQVMRSGKPMEGEPPSLDEIRAHARRERTQLPSVLTVIESGGARPDSPVSLSPGLQSEFETLRAKLLREGADPNE